MILAVQFFNQQPRALAKALLGKILRHRVNDQWLSARIIETEAYERTERGSHASLGNTPSRRAMFMPAGTIYMYYARGADSLNFSAAGSGNAVLIKSAHPVTDQLSPASSIDTMHRLNPGTRGARHIDKLCAGQTLLCKSLGLKVPEWNQKQLDNQHFRLEADGYQPDAVIQCRRLGIPEGRDEHLPYRYVDEQYAHCSTSNPLTKKGWMQDRDYHRIKT